MNNPRSVRVEVRVQDADEALRLVTVLHAVTTALWDTFGEEMSERLVDHHLGAQLDPATSDDCDLPF